VCDFHTVNNQSLHFHWYLQDKLWQCFLQGSESASDPATVEVSRIDRMGMDSAKLHCCSKAQNPTCKRLCLKTFSNEWTRSWDEFNRECLSELSEASLIHCIDEGNVVDVCFYILIHIVLSLQCVPKWTIMHYSKGKTLIWKVAYNCKRLSVWLDNVDVFCDLN